MSSRRNPLADLHPDNLVEVLSRAVSVCRTGQWLDGQPATEAERSWARKLLREANAAMLANGERAAL